MSLNRYNRASAQSRAPPGRAPASWRPMRAHRARGCSKAAVSRDKKPYLRKSLFDRRTWVAAIEFTGAIVLQAVREYQILDASRRAHRPGLDKATHTMDCERLVGLGRELSRDISHAPAIQEASFAQTIDRNPGHTHEIGQGFGIGL
jgi:hypothetical protein